MEGRSGFYEKSSPNESSSKNEYKPLCWKSHQIIRRDEMKTIHELLYKLLKKYGWEDEIREKVRAIWERRGTDAKMNDVIHEIMPTASKSVPPDVSLELEVHLRNTLRSRYKL
ncbi:hypothetical protein AWZ03_014121 [Drosophila navojoa]|uniref:Enhancer of yellow 2 transcription factor n=1 Tax=Drosophila navojoa TaxID=7232 RepID=A0A484AS06_DRONA|nr:hypothetical protein AWZ03_014121 [Drosophila navojoa]